MRSIVARIAARSPPGPSRSGTTYRSIPLGATVSPDGSKVYVTTANIEIQQGNTVSVIDTATNAVTATILVGGFGP
jgi:YVTN family beta-propeller protein